MRTRELSLIWIRVLINNFELLNYFHFCRFFLWALIFECKMQAAEKVLELFRLKTFQQEFSCIWKLKDLLIFFSTFSFSAILFPLFSAPGSTLLTRWRMNARGSRSETLPGVSFIKKHEYKNSSEQRVRKTEKWNCEIFSLLNSIGNIFLFISAPHCSTRDGGGGGSNVKMRNSQQQICKPSPTEWTGGI